MGHLRREQDADAGRGGRPWTPASLATLGIGLGALTAALVLYLFQFSGRFDALVYVSPDSGAVFNVASIVNSTALSGAAPSTPSVPSSTAAVAQLVIPSINVNAAVVVKGIGADGYMETPDNGYDVAWYDFSSHPGGVGNAVFSGHVDYYKIGPAVFWNLGKLQVDGEVDVRLADGTVYRYAVVGKGAFDANHVPIEQIIGATADDSITLITCTGTFDATTRQYDRRLVVRAKRIPDGAPTATGITGTSAR
jgi:LPXTG-site transpeptidase (sortase) family protein